MRRGFSLVELLIVVAIILVLLTVAIPIAKTARLNAAETTVMREMQTIHQAQLQYFSQFGTYASSLSQLGPPPNGVAGPQAARLIPASLASGERNGYVFHMARAGEGFTVHAEPKEFGTTGRRTFYIDDEGMVHHNWSRAEATAASPEVQ